MLRAPRGYRGINHETIGADLLSLPGAVLMPEHILGKAAVARLRSKTANAWYPIAELLEPLEELGRKLGADSLRKVGQTIFNTSHAAGLRRSGLSARELAHGLDGMYRLANRGKDIGAWAVLDFQPGKVILEKTTPHHCSMEEGILDAAFSAIGTRATIHQSACVRAGADACRFVITSHIVDHRWVGR